VEQVGVGPAARPADAAAELVELAEAEQVGPLDHEGVHGGHVDARLDDGGAHQHVVAPSQKSMTTCSSVPSSIWPWATAMRASGTSSRSRRRRCRCLHPVVHPEHLALAQQLAADRLGDPLVVLADVGEDRLAVGRRVSEQATGRGCR
jgi:hypothetical protein